MEPRRFELIPDVAPDVTIHVHDDRENASPDEDLIEIGFSAERHDGFGFGWAACAALAPVTLITCEPDHRRV